MRPGSKPHRLFWALRWHEGRVVPYGALIDVLWGDNPDGGPEDVMGNLAVHVTNLRISHGRRWRIAARYGHGLMIERR